MWVQGEIAAVPGPARRGGTLSGKGNWAFPPLPAACDPSAVGPWHFSVLATDPFAFCARYGGAAPGDRTMVSDKQLPCLLGT